MCNSKFTVIMLFNNRLLRNTYFYVENFTALYPLKKKLVIINYSTVCIFTLYMYNNGPYSLFVCASYFISCSVHARFTSVTFIDYKWHWGMAFLNFSCFNVLYRSYRVNTKVIDVLYILMYYYTGILFVVLCEGWVSYTRLFAGNLP